VRLCQADGGGWGEWEDGEISLKRDVMVWGGRDFMADAELEKVGPFASEPPFIVPCEWSGFRALKARQFERAAELLGEACDNAEAKSNVDLGPIRKACWALLDAASSLAEESPRRPVALNRACDAGIDVACRLEAARLARSHEIADLRRAAILWSRTCRSSLEPGSSCAKLGTIYDTGALEGTRLLQAPSEELAFEHYRRAMKEAGEGASCSKSPNRRTNDNDPHAPASLLKAECPAMWQAAERGGDLVSAGHPPFGLAQSERKGEPKEALINFYQHCSALTPTCHAKFLEHYRHLSVGDAKYVVMNLHDDIPDEIVQEPR
jgi:hypothetical protein